VVIAVRAGGGGCWARADGARAPPIGARGRCCCGGDGAVVPARRAGVRAWGRGARGALREFAQTRVCARGVRVGGRLKGVRECAIW